MTTELEIKLAELTRHLLDVEARKTERDEMMFRHYLNDPEIVNWVDRHAKAGSLRPRFITTILR